MFSPTFEFSLLEQQLPGGSVRLVEATTGDSWIELKSHALRQACQLLRDHQDCQFNVLSDLTAVDWFSPAGKNRSLPTHVSKSSITCFHSLVGRH